MMGLPMMLFQLVIPLIVNQLQPRRIQVAYLTFEMRTHPQVHSKCLQIIEPS